MSSETDYLYRFLREYPLFPSLALWRSIEARLFAGVNLREPVLDIGCGNGFFASVSFNARLYAGCDRDLRQVQRARSLETYEHVVVADVGNLPYGDGSFAAVVCNCVLEHVEDIESALREITRVLIPKGTLFLTVPTEKFDEWFYLTWFLQKTRMSGWGRRHIERYNRFQFHHHICPLSEWKEHLETNGLRVVRYEYYGSQVFQIFFSALDDVQHGIGRLVRAKNESSEDWSSRISEGFFARLTAAVAARFWWYLLLPLSRTEPLPDGRGAAVLVEAQKDVSEASIK
jgi:SAM-dependent methyltransferase